MENMIDLKKTKKDSEFGFSAFLLKEKLINLI